MGGLRISFLDGDGEIGFFIKLPFPSFWLSMDSPRLAPHNAYGPQPQPHLCMGIRTLGSEVHVWFSFFLMAMRLLFHSLLQVHAFISDTRRIPFVASKLSKELETRFFKISFNISIYLKKGMGGLPLQLSLPF